MRTDRDDLEDVLRQRFSATETGLVLRHDSRTAARRIALTPPRRSRGHKVWVLGMIGAAVVAGGGAAAAVAFSGNDASEQFAQLNPDKFGTGKTGYVTVGRISRGSTTAVFLVSTTPGSRTCGLVQEFAGGAEQSSFGFCGYEPADRPQLRRVTDILVASVPGASAASLTISPADGPPITSRLVRAHAVLDPNAVGRGPVTATVRDAAGSVLGTWRITVVR